MAFDYGPISLVAKNLIANFGRSCTFVELGDVAADPSKPYLGSASPRGTPKQTLVLPAVFVEPSSLDALGRADVSDDFLKRSTQIAIVFSSTALEPFDEILEADGSRWKIQDLMRLRPANVDVCWYVGLKR